MNNAKMLQFVKRWRALERDRKAYDYNLSIFARDLRNEFTSDAKFVKWCDVELGLTFGQAGELLTRVAVVKLVPDAATHERLGGFHRLRIVVERLDTRRAQIDAVEAAKASGKTIRTIVNERAGQSRDPIVVDSSRTDALALARFILSAVDHATIPEEIVVRLRRYVFVPHIRRAAAA